MTSTTRKPASNQHGVPFFIPFRASTNYLDALLFMLCDTVTQTWAPHGTVITKYKTDYQPSRKPRRPSLLYLVQLAGQASKPTCCTVTRIIHGASYSRTQHIASLATWSHTGHLEPWNRALGRNSVIGHATQQPAPLSTDITHACKRPVPHSLLFCHMTAAACGPVCCYSHARQVAVCRHSSGTSFWLSQPVSHACSGTHPAANNACMHGRGRRAHQPSPPAS
mmetsp:Transcript_2036/g.4514  ORF Transcript_2036/g.4514 Transcript_2036/m.4514 type:complete len:223 (-) Transcript_2036:322-990(-)